MEGTIQTPITSRTVEEVFRDFRRRREGLIKALTTEVEKFYQECDPEKENLSLYGLSNGSWEVNLPVEEVPPELPEPVLGINFAKEGMVKKDWLALVAVHSDSWLISVAYYFGARFGFNKNDRMRLFQMIHGLPTLFEVVSEKQQLKELSTTQSNGNKTKTSGKMLPPRSSEPHRKQVKMSPPPEADGNSDEEEEEEEEEEEADDDEGEGTCCGACGDDYAVDEFWICCDVCERWFHGKCVRITPAKAEHIKHYKCPSCSNKKGRVH